MNDFLMIFGSILFSFLLGMGIMLFFGGGTLVNYLKVRWGRGNKILIFVDTPTGRKTRTGKVEGDIKEGVVSWKYRGEVKLTELKKDYVEDFIKVKYIALNIDNPEKPYNLSVLGEQPSRAIDNTTFNNIVKRGLTRPSLDDDLSKKVKLLLILLALVVLGVIVVYMKLISVEQAIANLGVV